MKLGFIGFGEAAYNLAYGLKNEGLNELYAFDNKENDSIIGSLIQKRADELKIDLKSNAKEVVEIVDIVITAVPSTYTLDVLEEIKGSLKKGQFYVDVSASTSEAKQKIWENVKLTGAMFVDAAMMGSLPKEKHKVPIAASGNGAFKFKELMDSYNMNIELAGEEAGKASAIKLIRSIYMKGLSTLMLETMLAAESYGISDEIIQSLSKSLDGVSFESTLNRLVKGAAIHCKRRAAEMKGSLELLNEANLNSHMTSGTKKTLESLEKYDFANRYVNEELKGWERVIKDIRERN